MCRVCVRSMRVRFDACSSLCAICCALNLLACASLSIWCHECVLLHAAPTHRTWRMHARTTTYVRTYTHEGAQIHVHDAMHNSPHMSDPHISYGVHMHTRMHACTISYTLVHPQKGRYTHSCPRGGGTCTQTEKWVGGKESERILRQTFQVGCRTKLMSALQNMYFNLTETYEIPEGRDCDRCETVSSEDCEAWILQNMVCDMRDGLESQCSMSCLILPFEKIAGLGFCLHCRTRAAIRDMYNLPEEPCQDLLATCLCPQCALLQENNELKVRSGGVDAFVDEGSYQSPPGGSDRDVYFCYAIFAAWSACGRCLSSGYGICKEMRAIACPDQGGAAGCCSICRFDECTECCTDFRDQFFEECHRYFCAWCSNNSAQIS